MRKLFTLLLAFLAISLFTACGDDEKSDPKTCDNCQTWEECDDGTCVLKDGMCNADTDCTGDLVCNTANHTCESNNCDPACQEWETCNDGTCELTDGRCNADTDCANGEVCNTGNHQCETESTDCDPACQEWETCNAGTCELSNGRCAADTDCADGETCNTDTHLCEGGETGCTSDADCSGDTPVCNEAGECVGSECADVDCSEYANTHCEVGADGAGCYCDEGYALNAEGTACEEIPECTDDTIPNDFDTALAITLPYNDTHHICTDAGDYFTIDLEAGDTLFAFLTNFSNDIDIYLLNAPELVQDNVVAFSYAEGDGVEEAFNYTVETAGTYYVLVSPYGIANSDYTLELRTTCVEDAECGGAPMMCDNGECVEHCEADADCEALGQYMVCNTETNTCEEQACADDDAEPNNTVEEATEVTIPVVDAEYVICTGDFDIFKFDAAEGDTLSITIDFLHETGDLDIELYFGDLETEVESSAGVSDQEKITYMVDSADKAGTYYLKVLGYGEARNGYTLNIKTGCESAEDCPTGAYCNNSNACVALPETCGADADCEVEDSINEEDVYFCNVMYTTPVCQPYVAPTCGNDANEMNDMTSMATELTADTAANGVTCGEDYDWFVLELTEAVNTVDLELVFDGGDIDLYVMDSTFAMVGSSALENDITTGGTEVVSLGFVEAGTYYITVSTYSLNEGDTEQAYTLNVSEVLTDGCTDNQECIDGTSPMRSVCSETGACVNDDTLVDVEEAGFCEASDQCAGEGATCFDTDNGNAGLYDNFCAPACVEDTDCASGWCVPIGWFDAYCFPTCSEDADCSPFGEGAACNEGRCVTPE